MLGKKSDLLGGADLRARAEQALVAVDSAKKLSVAESGHLLHELRVHQTELAMQNEDLRRKELETNDLLSRYFEMYDQAPIGYLTLNEQGVILEANLTAASLFGVARVAVVKQLFTKFIYEEDQDIFYQNAKQLVGRAASAACDLRLRGVGGSGPSRWVHLEAVLAANGERRITLTDISELKKSVAECTTLNAQFQQAQKMEVVGRLVGGVAHDINNMLTVIIGHAELALAELDPSALVYGDLQQIYAVGTRSNYISRQLLAFARQQAIIPQVLDFNSTIEHMIKMLKRLIGEDIALFWKPGANLGPVKMDPGQIDQMLANLVVNARDAITDAGVINIETRFAEIDSGTCHLLPGLLPGKFLLLTVSDNGSGIEPATLKKIYEPFFTTKQPGKGTGLGLATVADIVKQNNGSIQVSSQVGKGTTFKIYLPICQSDAAIIAELRGNVAVPIGAETVLLVEDETSVLEVTKKMLEKLGYRVLAADSSALALHLAETHTGEIHLLLTDVIMPEMNGYELQRQLKKTRPKLAYLFMSGFPNNNVEPGIITDGDHFLKKPFVREQLAKQVRAVLEQPEAAGAAMANIATP